MELVNRVERLATKLTDFSKDYDYYGFCDAVESREEVIAETAKLLWDKGERKEILKWLDIVIDEAEEDEWAVKATELRREVMAL